MAKKDGETKRNANSPKNDTASVFNTAIQWFGDGLLFPHASGWNCVKVENIQL